jgi:hypothetical protein
MAATTAFVLRTSAESRVSHKPYKLRLEAELANEVRALLHARLCDLHSNGAGDALVLLRADESQRAAHQASRKRGR